MNKTRALAAAQPAADTDWQSLLDERDRHIAVLYGRLDELHRRLEGADTSDLLDRIRLLAKCANGDIYDLAYKGRRSRSGDARIEDKVMDVAEIHALRTVNRIIDLIDERRHGDEAWEDWAD